MYKLHDLPGPVRITTPDAGRRLASILLVTLAGLAGCTGPDQERPVTIQPGAPGEPGRVIDPGEAGDRTEPPPTAADVRFVQGMIAHHAQALELTGLVPARAEHQGIRRLAERIEISQADEITLMEGWLATHGEPAPPAGHHHGDAGQPPGMLTDQQLTQLAAATGPGFDRRFLEFMIYHHEGALIMVEELFAAGGGHQAEIFQLVGHIESDQRIEIDRMRDLLAELAAAG